MSPSTPSSGQSADTTTWRLWWRYHQDPYLELKRAIAQGAVITGSDEFFLGRGAQDGADVSAASLHGQRERSLAMLTETLAREQSPQLLSAALLAVARLASGAEDGEDYGRWIRPFLDDANRGVAETATIALGVLGDERGVDPLIHLSRCEVDLLAQEHQLEFGEHVPERQRAYAAYALGLIGERSPGYFRQRIVDTLTRLVMGQFHRSQSREVQTAAIVALGMVALPIDDGFASDVIAKPLAITYRQQQIRWLLATFDEPRIDEQARAQAPLAIARLLADVPSDFALRATSARALLAVIEPRSRSSNELRQGCVIALGRIADSDGDELDVEIRRALEEFSQRGAEVFERRLALLAMAESAGRPGAGTGEAIGGSAQAEQHLLRTLARGTSEMRCWAAIGLGLLDRGLETSGQTTTEVTEAALRMALDDARSPEEIGAFAVALGLARDVAAEPVLLRAFDRVSELGTIADLSLALGMVGARGAVTLLEDGLLRNQPDFELSRSTAAALALLGERSTIERLSAALARAKSSTSQATLCMALGTMGDATVAEPLLALAGDPAQPDAARASAVRGIADALDAEMIPWRSRIAGSANYRTDVVTLASPLTGTGVLDLR